MNDYQRKWLDKAHRKFYGKPYSKKAVDEAVERILSRNVGKKSKR